jgi:hypothetical protein
VTSDVSEVHVWKFSVEKIEYSMSHMKTKCLLLANFDHGDNLLISIRVALIEFPMTY